MMVDTQDLDRWKEQSKNTGVSRVILDVPKVIRPARTIRWVRVVITCGHISCKDDTIRRKVEALKPIDGPLWWDPEPDWTLAEECRKWLPARIIEKIGGGYPRTYPGPAHYCDVVGLGSITNPDSRES